MHAARTSFAVTLILWTLGCGAATPTTHSVRIAPEVLHSSNRCKGFDGGPTVPNSVITCETEAGALFATILEDCSIPEKFTFQATTRQLLVGMTDMSIVSQTAVSAGATKQLHSVVKGAIDAAPVLLSFFTSRRDGCVTDLVMWKGVPQGEVAPEVLTQFTSASRELASILVPPPVTPAQPVEEGEND